VAIVWTEILKPKWWEPMVKEGHWLWIFAFVTGLMYYFIYSKKRKIRLGESDSHGGAHGG